MTLGEKVNTGSYIGIQKLIGRVRNYNDTKAETKDGHAHLAWKE